VVKDNAERKKVWEEKKEELRVLRVDREQARIEKEIGSMRKEMEALIKKLNNL